MSKMKAFMGLARFLCITILLVPCMVEVCNLSFYVAGFPVPSVHNSARRMLGIAHRSSSSGSRLWYIENDGEDDDDSLVQPYRNRSLSWTKRYRRLVPYEQARALALRLGVGTKEEYSFYRRGPYMIQNPDEMYALEWEGWDEFLGVMRSYVEAKYVVQNVLKISSMHEYKDFVAAHPKRAEGLRLPARPDIVYRDSGWEGDSMFFYQSKINP